MKIQTAFLKSMSLLALPASLCVSLNSFAAGPNPTRYLVKCETARLTVTDSGDNSADVSGEAVKGDFLSKAIQEIEKNFDVVSVSQPSTLAAQATPAVSAGTIRFINAPAILETGVCVTIGYRNK